MKADFKVLGPKYHRYMKEVVHLISKTDFNDVLELKKNKCLQLGRYTFSEEDFILTSEEELNYSRYLKLKRILGI